MNEYHQRKLYKHVAIAAFIEIAITIACIVYGMIVVIQNNELPNNIFELIYMGAHIIIACFIAIMAIGAIRNKPFILKSLTLDTEGNKKGAYPIVGIIIAVLGVGMIVLGILLMVKVIPSSFPLFLNLDIANGGLTLIIVGLSIFLFPFSYQKDHMKEIIAKHKGEIL